MKSKTPHYKTNKQLFEKVHKNPQLQKELSLLKNKWKISHKQIEDNSEELQRFHNEIVTILKRHKVHYSLFDSIINHLKYDWNLVPVNNINGLDIHENEFGEKEILIKISGKTTLSDIKSYWPTVKRFQKRLTDFSSKNRPDDPRLSNRNQTIMSEYKKGTSIGNIADMLNDEKEKDDVQDKEHYSMTEDAIRQVIKRKKNSY